MQRTLVFGGVCAAALGVAFLLPHGGGAAAAAADSRCDAAAIQGMAPADTTVESATVVDAPTSYCKVTGHIQARSPDSTIGFTLSLPLETFNGRYYFMGLGGAAGFMPPPPPKIIGAGFAVAVTDTGHKGAILDWSFGYKNPTGMLDYSHRAAHLTAVATQAITRRYYSRDKIFRYHLGCSGGGRMGEMAAERHPEDYDGIVIGAPGIGPNGDAFVWTSQQVLRNDQAWVSPAKLSFMEKTIQKQCAGPNGLVTDPKACGFDPASLLCKSGDGPTCLTSEEIKTVKAIAGGPPPYPGQRRAGYSMTNPTGWSQFLMGYTKPVLGKANPWEPNAPPPGYSIAHTYMRDLYMQDRNYDFVRDFHYDDPAEVRKYQAGFEKADNMPRDPASLAAFKKAGGKIIYWAGIPDPGPSVSNVIRHYEQLEAAVPATPDFARLFLAPGTWHCGGGIGPQDVPDRALEKVIAWVEHGTPPDSMLTQAQNTMEAQNGGEAHGAPAYATAPTRTVLLCPYPKRAKFIGKSGDFGYDAASYRCMPPG